MMEEPERPMSRIKPAMAEPDNALWVSIAMVLAGFTLLVAFFA